MAETSTEHLKRVLKPIHLWAIAVGLVISGEYFGWNLGWAVSGTIGLLIATLVITLMYITFIFSYTELTASIPHAGGAFAYAYRAMGPFGGLIAGYATLVDFLVATPAVAVSLGSYLHFLYPAIPIAEAAMGFNVLFILLNMLGVKESATFSVFITILAVIELLLYLGIVSPHFKMVNYLTNPMPFGWAGVFAALPFAVWFYLAIEGVAMVAEEVENPKRNIPRGYISAIITLVVLALGVMIITGGLTDWRKLSHLDYPLPEAIGIVLGKGNGLTKIFASIGLFGLIASLHGIILASSRQVFAMARSGYLPRMLSDINHRFKTPHWALVVSGVVSSIFIYKFKTDQIIMLSVLGAVVMYIMSMLSLFILRKKEPRLSRPFLAPVYPVFPAIALVICVICLIATIYFNPDMSLIFAGGLVIVLLIFIVMGKHKVALTEDMMSAPMDEEVINH
ncbi:ethanolamine permease [Mucilaginibacter rubeus]|uniref:Ethanolamine permease n=1 Tax=Mucilaginibacter rubeus TaxID=2027860 RepID=A0AAE6JCV0_9SPHI|nr:MULTISPECIES: ethanolamine permease [Mucilaginibacter]QEM03253.1 ethanolamine permease [Mucilaginibacter rubeus]QEM15871.1 ethanolamine permease [Mucilaginibacter gossypii]QTE41389.1 ethanolamine permease [Mucilaginibacter rubeus]QTE47992.1 ethanolamine permease [Mucilaginibacter rubeus]QTE59386.1 ethanolamine permease [Mucilaginibacter rubeus]